MSATPGTTSVPASSGMSVHQAFALQHFRSAGAVGGVRYAHHLHSSPRHTGGPR